MNLMKLLKCLFQSSISLLLSSLQSLESLTECCESALSLLGEALQSMDTEPLPDNIKVQKTYIMCFFDSVCQLFDFTRLVCACETKKPTA